MSRKGKRHVVYMVEENFQNGKGWTRGRLVYFTRAQADKVAQSYPGMIRRVVAFRRVDPEIMSTADLRLAWSKKE